MYNTAASITQPQHSYENENHARNKRTFCFVREPYNMCFLVSIYAIVFVFIHIRNSVHLSVCLFLPSLSKIYNIYGLGKHYQSFKAKRNNNINMFPYFQNVKYYVLRFNVNETSFLYVLIYDESISCERKIKPRSHLAEYFPIVHDRG